MRFTNLSFNDILDNWPHRYAKDYDHATKVVYGWVKQDQISPKQMADLIEIAYKHFVY